MKVCLRYKTAATPSGQHRFVEYNSMKEALEAYKNKYEELCTTAWISRFDGWRDHMIKVLKKQENMRS